MKNLKILRVNKGLTQKECADKLNMPKTTYCYYEQGRINPSIDTIFKFADFFNCSTDYLLGYRISISKIKQQLLTTILNLDDDLCDLAEAYIEGLKATQQQRDRIRERARRASSSSQDVD